MSITSDPTVAGTRGSFGWDDEGTPARRAGLIEEGIFRRTLSNRDSAARSGLEITGAARADGWAYLPVCFSTHVFLEPGSGSLAELLDRLGDGYYIEDNRSWSIDNRRLNFQFGTEVAYEVRRGRQGRLLRNFSYGGITPQFWNSVEAVAGAGRVPDLRLPLRQGRAQAVGFPQPRGGAAARPRNQDRSRMMLPPLDEARTMEALDAALRSTAADEFEISVLARSGEYTRFAGQVIHQPQDIVEVQYLVRALVNGHPYRVATSTAADLERAVAAAAAGRAPGRSCRRRPGRSAWPQPQPEPTPQWWHRRRGGGRAPRGTAGTLLV